MVVLIFVVNGRKVPSERVGTTVSFSLITPRIHIRSSTLHVPSDDQLLPLAELEVEEGVSIDDC